MFCLLCCLYVLVPTVSGESKKPPPGDNRFAFASFLFFFFRGSSCGPVIFKGFQVKRDIRTLSESCLVSH